jgi:hypothetical protein
VSVDLFVYRTGFAITAVDLRKACESVSRRFPGLLIDTEWNATDQTIFPYSQSFFWQVDRAYVELALPPDAEDFEVDGQSHGNFAYVHICSNASQFVFSDFLAHALATELNAEIFDPQAGEVIPVSIPSLAGLRERHQQEIDKYAPVLKKEYQWQLPGDELKSADENFEFNAQKFNRDLTASVKGVFDPSFPGLRITRNTFSDLSNGLKLFASFDNDSSVTVLLTADLDREELFDRFANDLAARFGSAFRSRKKYVFRRT